MLMLQTIVGLLAWILIALFLWELRWRGRAIVLVFVAISIVLPYLGNADSVHLFGALGFAIRVALGVVYLIWRRLPSVSP